MAGAALPGAAIFLVELIGHTGHFVEQFFQHQGLAGKSVHAGGNGGLAIFQLHAGRPTTR